MQRVLGNLVQRGVRFEAAEDALKVQLGNATLSDSESELLKERKAEILELLSGGKIACLSYAQERLWFLAQLGYSTQYNVPGVVQIEGALDADALEAALNSTLARHEILRTGFVQLDGAAAVQRIHPEALLQVQQRDLTALDDAEKASRKAELVKDIAEAPFDLAAPPLLRATLIRTAPDAWTLAICMHHIVCDGWSMGILVREIGLAYEAFAGGSDHDLPPLPLQYADYAVWQRETLTEEKLDEELAAWKEALEGHEDLHLPTDFPRPAQISGDGSRSRFLLSAETAQALKDVCQANQKTLFAALMAGLYIVLRRYSGQEDICIGMAVANRNRIELESLVGFFVNALTIRIRPDASEAQTVARLLDTVQAELVSAQDRQNVPFEKVVEVVQPSRDLGRSPIFQVTANQVDRQESAFALGESRLVQDDLEVQRSKFDLSFEFSNAPDGGVNIQIDYSTDLYRPETMERLGGHLISALSAIAANLEARIDEIDLMQAAERELLTTTWNSTAAEFPRERCVHELFESQVEKTPDHLALEFNGESLTYRELNERANRLAHTLAEAGVGRGTVVAVLVERSIEMAISLIAVLKAGGAYLPLDTTNPAERIRFMLEDSGADVLIAHQETGRAYAASVSSLHDPFEASAYATESENLKQGSHPDDLIYLIYTSGSTGQPKGVLVRHIGIVNLVYDRIRVTGESPETRQSQIANLSFDAMAGEIWPTWLTGGAVFIADDDTRMDPVRMREWLIANRITISFQPTAVAELLLKDEWPAETTALQALISAGDKLNQHPPAGLPFTLFNFYGPTEDSVWTTWKRVSPEPDDGALPSIGVPVANHRVYIVSGQDMLQPIGVPGELCIAGVGLSRGYLNRPELTRERFVDNPFEPGEKMYRTGDLARWLPNSEIEFLGRLDSQVKVRGFRIELGEIEKTLTSHPAVGEAVAVVERERNRIVGYYTGTQDAATLELWPSVAEFFIYDDVLYYAMTHDERRNASYSVAFEQHVKGKVVLDVGTGKDAILSRLCVEAGARHVYAIELLEKSFVAARACIREHGLEDIITLIHGDATQVELPEKVDVCVSEIVGPIGGCEGGAKILKEAWRLMKEDAVMIPSRSTTRIAAVTLPDAFVDDPAFTPATADYVQQIFDQVGHAFDLRLSIRGLDESCLVSDDDIFEDLDFGPDSDLEYTREIRLRMHRNARMDGLLVWLNLYTTPDEVIDILAHEHCWLPVFLPAFSPGIEVAAGDEIIATVRGTLCENGLNPDYTITGHLQRQSGESLPFTYDAVHFRQSYRQNPFYQKLFADDRIPVREANGNVAALRSHLQRYLPEFMMPSALVRVDGIPKTPNGKVDRKALVRRDAQAERLQPFVSPESGMERQVARIWQQTLGVDQVGAEDSFFELGGHSLLAVQIVSRIKQELGVDLPLRKFFQAPTVRGLCSELEAGPRVALERVVKVGRPVRIPLSFPQERLWFLAQFGLGEQYHIFGATRISGPLNDAALDASLGYIVSRHESLRTGFRADNGDPEQFISKNSFAGVQRIDLTGLGPNEREGRAESILDEIRTDAFDLSQPPLLRIALIRLDRQSHILALCMHHIISDGWSMGVFVNELSAAYAAFDTSPDATPDLPPLPVQYPDYAVWQREKLASARLDAMLSDWRTRLEGYQDLDLPTDYARPKQLSGRGANFEMQLPDRLAALVKTTANANRVTLFTILTAGVYLLLRKYSGQDDFCIGVPGANRAQSETEGLIGFFVNTLVVRLAAGAGNGITLPVLLERVQNEIAAAQDADFLPFEKIVDAVQPDRDLSRSPIFQVMVNYLPQDNASLQLGQCSLEPMHGRDDFAKFDLTFTFLDTPAGGLDLRLNFSTDLFQESSIERMAGHLASLFDRLCAGGDQPVDALDILDVSERTLVLETWNNTAAPFPDDVCVHQLFEQQAGKSPDAVAVSYSGKTLTYRELDEKVTQLAIFLQQQGVGPDSLVGLCLERSLEMEIGILGILKAGGAYVPVEPGYPATRQQYMFADCTPALILTQSDLKDHVRELAAVDDSRILALDAEWDRVAASSGELSRAVQPEHAAYVIYTSGSTGRPKGVLVSHRAICNRLVWMQETYQLNAEDRVLQKTPFGFDVSVWEFLWPVLTGARLVFAPPEVHKDPAALALLISEENITTLHFVPSMLQAFLTVDGVGAQCSSVRRVICSGEALGRDVHDRCLATLDCELHNLYGPTEAAVDVTSWACRPGGTGSIPIGRPISNTQIYILDNLQRPVPVGVPGELYIAGTNLARGYVNRSELTASRFVENPFEPGTRMYRTGDLARWLEDGSIAYLGRLDHQVKIRGFRIECGEIETVLAGHAGVEQPVVIAQEVRGNQQLIAYYTGGPAAAEGAELRDYLQSRLPDYMIPAGFVLLDAIPLSANGKVDRKALQKQEVGLVSSEAYVAPRTETEVQLARIWESVLHSERIGVHDNFFELGGHSLLAVQIISRIQMEMGVDVPLSRQFEFPTISSFAQQIETDFLLRQATRVRAEDAELETVEF